MACAVGRLFWAERCLADRQRASEERLGRGEASLREIEDGQIVERGGEGGIIGPRGLLDLGDLRFELVRALLRCDGWRRSRGRRLCRGATAAAPARDRIRSAGQYRGRRRVWADRQGSAASCIRSGWILGCASCACKQRKEAGSVDGWESDGAL